MADAQKKVIVRPFTGAPVAGYLPASGFGESENIGLMDTAGRLISLPINDIRLIAYVRDFNTSDAEDPERIGRRSFQARPRGPGLWVRVTFRDGESLEGLAADDLSFIDALLQDRGLFLTPPDARANTHRVFVPRSALSAFEVLGNITTATRRKAIERATREPQPSLFGDP